MVARREIANNLRFGKKIRLIFGQNSPKLELFLWSFNKTPGQIFLACKSKSKFLTKPQFFCKMQRFGASNYAQRNYNGSENGCAWETWTHIGSACAHGEHCRAWEAWEGRMSIWNHGLAATTRSLMQQDQRNKKESRIKKEPPKRFLSQAI